jgi:uncharacterized membrane protein
MIRFARRTGLMPGGGHTVGRASSTWAARRTISSGALFGIGLAAFIDETVFHQLLHWHHFYDRSTTAAGLISDGLFHAFGWFAVVVGLFLLLGVRRQGRPAWGRWIGALLLGAGGFQLYDGTVQHKLLGLHQIRYHVNVVPYDITWDITAVIMIGIGLVLVLRHRRPSGAATEGGR